MSARRAGLAALGLVLLAGPALALSCMRPDVARSFAQLDAAEEMYIAVHGQLDFDEAGLPVTDWDNQLETPGSTPLPARLSGRALTPEGFVVPFDHDITLDVLCFGPWCAGATSGSSVLAFVELRPDGYVFALDPCYGTAFFEPTQAMLDTALSCMQGLTCSPAE